MGWVRRHGGRVLAVGLAAVLPLAGGCGSDGHWPDRPGPKVVVSFAPIACFALNVAGDDAVVKNLMTSTGPHDFNPTDADAKVLARADLFLINGLDLDDEMAGKLKRGSGNRKLAVVPVADRVPPGRRIRWAADRPGHEGHQHGQFDPHAWLGPDRAVTMVEAVRDALKERDPAHAAGYDDRAAAYAARLRKLKADGEELLRGVPADARKVVTFHESLGYLADEFGVRVAGVVMKKPGVEPNPAEVERLARECQEHGVRVIAIEPQYSSRNTAGRAIVEALRRKGVADPVLAEVDPLETVTPDDLTADWYERKMRANLAALAGALK